VSTACTGYGARSPRHRCPHPSAPKTSEPTPDRPPRLAGLPLAPTGSDQAASVDLPGPRRLTSSSDEPVFNLGSRPSPRDWAVRGCSDVEPVPLPGRRALKRSAGGALRSGGTPCHSRGLAARACVSYSGLADDPTTAAQPFPSNSPQVSATDATAARPTLEHPPDIPAPPLSFPPPPAPVRSTAESFVVEANPNASGRATATAIPSAAALAEPLEPDADLFGSGSEPLGMALAALPGRRVPARRSEDCSQRLGGIPSAQTWAACSCFELVSVTASHVAAEARSPGTCPKSPVLRSLRGFQPSSATSRIIMGSARKYSR